MSIPLRARDRRILIATAVLAIGMPLGAVTWVDARTASLASHLAAAGGVGVRIGHVDADLTGSILLSDVAFGELIAADAIEASVALASLLDGQLRADEIRIAGPRVTIEVGADGDSDLARLARRLAKHGSRGSGTAGRFRRIVVSAGTLTARIAGVGVLAADGVELVPDAGGVRVITRAVRVHGTTGPVAVDLAFSRSAAELALPQMKFRRVLAVGGAGTVTTGMHAVVVRDIAAGRLAEDGSFEVRASIDDAGIARPLALELTRSEASRPGLSLALRGTQIPLDGLGAFVPRGVGLEGAHATGSLHVRKHAHTVEITADGSVDGVALDHRSLAPAPIPVAAAVRARVSVAPQAIAISELAIATGAIRTRASGWLRRGAPASGQLELEVAAAPCADLLSAVPIEVRGPLDGMVVDGSLGGRARLSIDLAAPVGEGVQVTTGFEGGCTVVAEPPAADVTTLLAAGEHQFADGSQARVGPDEPGWVAYRDLSSRVRGAFVSAEDGTFWDHGGFDLNQIARSLEIDLREGRLARGGSTISQQLVKNALLTHRRTLDRKLQEAVLTWRLEARLDKKQILERYLNIIELGPRVFGVGAAARHWFDTRPRELTPRQAAFLAAMTSEPTSMSRRVRRHGGLDPESAERVATILRAMKRDGVLSDHEYDEARAAPMQFSASAVRADR